MLRDRLYDMWVAASLTVTERRTKGAKSNDTRDIGLARDKM